LGVDKSVIERVDVEDGGDVLVVHARPGRAARGRCGVCRRRCGGYDAGEGRRRWRALDAGTARVIGTGYGGQLQDTLMTG
jgi:transposase